MSHDYPDIKTQYERLRYENFMLKHENRLLKDQLNEASAQVVGESDDALTLRQDDDDWDDVQPVA